MPDRRGIRAARRAGGASGGRATTNGSLDAGSMALKRGQGCHGDWPPCDFRWADCGLFCFLFVLYWNMQFVLELDGGREFRPREGCRPPRYFFALLPDAEAGLRIDRLARDLHQRLSASGELRGLGKYHVTLRGIAVPDGPFGQSIAMARTIAEAIRKTSFAVKFDQAASFGKPPNYAFSLMTREDLPGANGLSAALLGALRQAGLKVDGSTFQPHVTLFYDRRLREPIDVPELRWQVRAFVLVESIDRQPYQILGSWKLG